MIKNMLFPYVTEPSKAFINFSYGPTRLVLGSVGVLEIYYLSESQKEKQIGRIMLNRCV